MQTVAVCRCLVPSPHYSARPMRLGSRGPGASWDTPAKCLDREGLVRFFGRVREKQGIVIDWQCLEAMCFTNSDTHISARCSSTRPPEHRKYYASVNSRCTHASPGNCGAFFHLVSPRCGAVANFARHGGLVKAKKVNNAFLKFWKCPMLLLAFVSCLVSFYWPFFTCWKRILSLFSFQCWHWRSNNKEMSTRLQNAG